MNFCSAESIFIDMLGEGHVVDSDGEENEEMTGEYSIHLGARSNQNQKLGGGGIPQT